MSYLSRLSKSELKSLRAAVRRVHFQYFPGDEIPNTQVDMMIESMGEQAAERCLETVIKAGLLEGKIMVGALSKIIKSPAKKIIKIPAKKDKVIIH